MNQWKMKFKTNAIYNNTENVEILPDKFKIIC